MKKFLYLQSSAVDIDSIISVMEIKDDETFNTEITIQLGNTYKEIKTCFHWTEVMEKIENALHKKRK